MKNSNNSTSVVKVAVIGASLAGLAATAYFFFGPNGEKHQKNTRAWAIKMKGDVIEKLEMADKVSESVYHDIIDSVAEEYEKGKRAGHNDIVALTKDLKKHWKTILTNAEKAKNRVKKGTK